MNIIEVLDQVRELLRSKGRVTYRILKRQFGLDDEALEDIKAELIKADRVARDEDGEVLVWVGDGVTPSQPPQLQPRSAPRSQPEQEAPAGERRQLTVMFCDLVGSTALSEQLDPEDLHAVVRTYQDACRQMIERYEGHIAQYLGDGILVYFGYPAAHEDDAIRGVRAGLDILAALPTLELAQPIQARIGLHTGPVVIGAVGGGEHTEQLALGETPNIAARVQGKAEPNTIAISHDTYRLVRGFFVCEDLGSQDLKGLSSPLALYHVTGEGEAQSRFEVAARTGLTPLVGREEEVSLLHKRWQQAAGGQGQAVTVSGEAGIGKSRLVQELREHVGKAGGVRIEYQCSPYHQNSALYPVIQHVERVLGVASDDTPATKLVKLQRSLSAYRFPQADTVPLFASLLSLPHPEDSPPITVSPQKQKEQTQAALMAWLLEETEKAPVCCTWEDLHWADPSTLEFLRLCLDQVPTSRMLTLLTFRPEFTPPWSTHSYLSQLTLNRLGKTDLEAMVEEVTGGKRLPAEVMQQIASKTDGVPLFVEELTKTVVESDFVRAVNGHYELTGPLPPLAIPSTLQDSLMARLDRLASVREVAQLGATLGREFSYELITVVSPLGEESLQQGLRQLVDAELVYQRGLPPQARYLFKHALIQDTAYESLLKSQRQQLHRQVAHVLEQQFPETVDTQPELVAHHYTEASLAEQAIPYWQQAGERAVQRSANQEAIGHLTKGLALLQTLPDTPEHTQQELTLQITLGAPLVGTKGYAAPEVGEVYRRARELCGQLGESPQLFPVLYGLYAFYLIRVQLQPAQELAEQLLSMAHDAADLAFRVQAHWSLGCTLYVLGEPHSSRTHLEQSVALYDFEQHRSMAHVYGHDPAMSSLAIGAFDLWLLGYPDQALRRIHEALTLARKLAHPFSLAFALHYAAFQDIVRREVQVTHEWVEELMALSRDHGFALFVAMANIYSGWGLAVRGQVEEGLTEIRQGLSAVRVTGSEVFRPSYLSFLAETHRRAGQTEAGLSAVAEALTAADEMGERWYEAELYRLKGELTLQSDGQNLASATQQEAEACFHKAIDIAQQQHAKSWELRAATSLARLWQQQGKQAEARELLAPVYGWFTEGFDTADLMDAKALLDTLAGGP